MFRVAITALVLASALGALGALGWPFELFSHFNVQYAAAWVLVALMLFVRHARLAAFAALGLAAVQAWPETRFGAAVAEAAHCRGPALELVTANVHYRNEDTGPLLDWLRKAQADAVIVQELTPHWAEAISESGEWPYTRLMPRSDAYGIGVLARIAPLAVSEVDFAGDGLPSLVARVSIAGQPVDVIAMHARWPMTPDLLDKRNAALDGAAAFARRSDAPVVMIGDFNLTPASPQFGRLLAASGLTDVFAGRGWHPTWNARFWPLALRIDNALVSPGLCVEAVEVGPAVGSDHRPVRVRLRLPEAPGVAHSAGNVSPVGGGNSLQRSTSQVRKRTTLGSVKLAGGATR